MVGGPSFHPITKLFQSGGETLLLQNGEGLMSSGSHSYREKLQKSPQEELFIKMLPYVMDHHPGDGLHYYKINNIDSLV